MNFHIQWKGILQGKNIVDTQCDFFLFWSLQSFTVIFLSFGQWILAVLFSASFLLTHIGMVMSVGEGYLTMSSLEANKNEAWSWNNLMVLTNSESNFFRQKNRDMLNDQSLTYRKNKNLQKLVKLMNWRFKISVSIPDVTCNIIFITYLISTIRKTL